MDLMSRNNTGSCFLKTSLADKRHRLRQRLRLHKSDPPFGVGGANSATAKLSFASAPMYPLGWGAQFFTQSQLLFQLHNTFLGPEVANCEFLIFALQRKGYSVSQDTLTSLGILTAAELIPRFPALFIELGEIADMCSEDNALPVTERMEGYIACYESFNSLKAFGQDKKLVAKCDPRPYGIEKIREVYEHLKAKGVIEEIEEPEVPELPMDYAKAVKQGKVRRPTCFVYTISDDRGEEATYGGVPISEVIEKGYSIADVIGLLWFKREFPAWASNFIDMVIKVVADHGSAVSGALTARAGKDLMPSLATAILTIGPRFSGAINGAARYFKMAKEIGVFLVDMFKSLGYSDKEIDEFINAGAFNAFFVLGRSIGFIGHILDEKRLGIPLYRHPWDDILYDVKRPEEA